MDRNSLKHLDNKSKLHAAAMNKEVLYVYMGEEEIGKGVADLITDDVVRIDHENYMRIHCKFYTA